MGFCLFNNVAVAAEHARQALGLDRVMIVDFDVHHCNGTQHIFYDRADVLVMSCHRYPFYPGTGALVELGEGEGTGYTVNLPLPAAVGDPTVLAGFEATLLQIAEAFDPQLILVSAGFDAHLFDPLGGLRMSEAGYGVLMGWLVDAANRSAAQGRLVTVLEGGYDLDALSRSMRVCTEVMGGETPPRLEFGEEEHALGLVDLYRQTHEPYWPVGYA
jgi:acetoin utilization deacetylase AcuC-like enzyme